MRAWNINSPSPPTGFSEMVFNYTHYLCRQLKPNIDHCFNDTKSHEDGPLQLYAIGKIVCFLHFICSTASDITCKCFNKNQTGCKKSK